MPQRRAQTVSEAAPADLGRLFQQGNDPRRRRAGIGALAFAFVDPAEAGKWAGEYYDIIKSEECVPIGHTVNANIAMATGFSVHHEEAEAKARGLEAFQYFGFALGHFYVYGQHQTRCDQYLGTLSDRRIVAAGRRARQRHRHAGATARPAARYQDAGVDQVIFVQQAGRNKHDHIIESLKLFAAEVMPFMKPDQQERDRRKQEELAPYIEAALCRKQWMQPLADGRDPRGSGLWQVGGRREGRHRQTHLPHWHGGWV